jgi:hypothetical protein
MLERWVLYYYLGVVLLGECVCVYGSGHLSVYSPHDTNDHHNPNPRPIYPDMHTSNHA